MDAYVICVTHDRSSRDDREKRKKTMHQHIKKEGTENTTLRSAQLKPLIGATRPLEKDT